jgi:hypothetical protein
MARARNIKPGFFKNEDLAECSPWARLCFAGLWTLADREGRLEDRPKRIKGELFPYDSIEVEPLLQELERFKFIVRYETEGMKAIQIAEFKRHQSPHYSESQSVIKPPGLPEGPELQAPPTPGVLPEDSEKPTVIKRGSQPPDSLIPDSLIPDTGKEKTRKRADPPPSCPEDVEPQVWSDWSALRSKKRATVSQTAVEEARKEAVKAGVSLNGFLRIWCRRGSQGLEASWLKADEINAAQANGETAWQRSQRERVHEMTGGLASRKPPTAVVAQTTLEIDDVRPLAPRLG